MIDLKSLSVAELLELQKAIPAELEARLRAERQNLLNEFRERARSLGISLEELVGLGRRTRANTSASGKSAIKYVHPQDPTLTWSGRGKRPRWVHEWLESGRSLEELAG